MSSEILRHAEVERERVIIDDLSCAGEQDRDPVLARQDPAQVMDRPVLEGAQRRRLLLGRAPQAGTTVLRERPFDDFDGVPGHPRAAA
ncbi:hypothetical protein [Methylobacterium crusticola]|uniref:hypothetical protein n=1 Tax=Methylobacterium crusticola TaxID=1697972 RepID=UPI000FFB77DE|nr:hypothetical protein [Methylobacterium crusticola]